MAVLWSYHCGSKIVDFVHVAGYVIKPQLTYSPICGLKSLFITATIRSISVIVHKRFTKSYKRVREPNTAQFPYTASSIHITKHLNVIFGTARTVDCGRGGRREKEEEKEERRWRIRRRKKRRSKRRREEEVGRRIRLQLVTEHFKTLTEYFTTFENYSSH